VSAREMEIYIDFFDYVFNRSDYPPENRLYTSYSFEEWVEQSGEKVIRSPTLKKLKTHSKSTQYPNGEIKKAKF
jgi:hypothetical protein